MIKEVIVTGGAGFIGANLVRALSNKGLNVHVFDNLSTGNIKNLSLDKIQFHNIDLKKNFKKWPRLNTKEFRLFSFDIFITPSIPSLTSR